MRFLHTYLLSMRKVSSLAATVLEWQSRSVRSASNLRAAIFKRTYSLFANLVALLHLSSGFKGQAYTYP